MVVEVVAEAVSGWGGAALPQHTCMSCFLPTKAFYLRFRAGPGVEEAPGGLELVPDPVPKGLRPS